MKLNIIEKILIILVIILISCAGFNIYKQNTDINKKLNRLMQGNISYSSEEFPKDFKKLSIKYHLYEDLYNTDETILTFGYEDRPMTLGYGKDFHDDFLKLLEKENINYKVIPYHNFLQQKEDIIDQKGNQSGCSMNNGLEEDLNTLLNKTEECLNNICLINNKQNEFIMLSRNNINYAIKILKELNQENNPN